MGVSEGIVTYIAMGVSEGIVTQKQWHGSRWRHCDPHTVAWESVDSVKALLPTYSGMGVDEGILTHIQWHGSQ